MVDWCKKTYEGIFEDDSGALKITHGMLHSYLRSNLDFTTQGEVKISMILYTNKIVEELTPLAKEHPKCTPKTPAADHLFIIMEDAKRLSPKDLVIFHTFVAKLLFLTRRARPDISTVVVFLTTRVTKSTIKDWKKLEPVIFI